MSTSAPDSAGWILDEADAEHFWSRVNFAGGTDWQHDPLVNRQRVHGECWLWTGPQDRSASRYGVVRRHGRSAERAHRIAYRDAGHEIPDDHEVDHLCRRTMCVNPSHLEAVEHAENMRRGLGPLLNRGACRNGHKVTPENVLHRRSGKGRVHACRVCINESKRRSYQRRKAASKI